MHPELENANKQPGKVAAYNAAAYFMSLTSLVPTLLLQVEPDAEETWMTVQILFVLILVVLITGINYQRYDDLVEVRKKKYKFSADRTEAQAKRSWLGEMGGPHAGGFLLFAGMETTGYLALDMEGQLALVVGTLLLALAAPSFVAFSNNASDAMEKELTKLGNMADASLAFESCVDLKISIQALNAVVLCTDVFRLSRELPVKECLLMDQKCQYPKANRFLCVSGANDTVQDICEAYRRGQLEGETKVTVSVPVRLRQDLLVFAGNGIDQKKDEGDLDAAVNNLILSKETAINEEGAKAVVGGFVRLLDSVNYPSLGADDPEWGCLLSPTQKRNAPPGSLYQSLDNK